MKYDLLLSKQMLIVYLWTKQCWILQLLILKLMIDNYIVYRKDRNRRGGGVALFVNKSLNSTEIDLNLSTECICVKVKLKK